MASFFAGLASDEGAPAAGGPRDATRGRGNMGQATASVIESGVARPTLSRLVDRDTSPRHPRHKPPSLEAPKRNSKSCSSQLFRHFPRRLPMVLGARVRALAVDALGYAKGVPELALDDRAFREFIVWLEDTKIRAMPMDARGPLRAVDAPAAAWNSAFASLVAETGCELDVDDAAQTPRVFDHLLEQAVALDYRDNADDFGAVVKDLKLASIGAAPPPPKRQKTSAGGVQGAGERDEDAPRPRMRGLTDPSLVSALDELAAVLRVEIPAGSGVEASADACVAAVERFIAPFWSKVEEAERNAGDGKEGRGDERWNLSPSDFPSGVALGFDEDGDGGCGAAATAAVNVLRALHVNDLRVLQSAVDALLVQMQEYTSDPKTDSRLGRVGSG